MHLPVSAYMGVVWARCQFCSPHLFRKQIVISSNAHQHSKHQTTIEIKAKLVAESYEHSWLLSYWKSPQILILLQICDTDLTWDTWNYRKIKLMCASTRYLGHQDIKVLAVFGYMSPKIRRFCSSYLYTFKSLSAVNSQVGAGYIGLLIQTVGGTLQWSLEFCI